jgi:hypothetical protein
MNCIGKDVGATRLSASDEYVIDLTDQEAGLYFIEIIQINIHRFVKVVKR